MNTNTQVVTPGDLLSRWATTLARDRVVQAMLVLLILLALTDSPQLSVSLRSTIGAMWSMAPFLAIAIGFAAYAKASGADQLIAMAFQGNPIRATVLASLVGALSPFCSCGVIPLIAAFLGAGVPLAPVMAFWIASPVMDPEMFVLTAAGIGVNFAVAKLLAAIAMGLTAGFTVLLLQRRGYLQSPLRAAPEGSGCTSRCSGESPSAVEWAFWRSPKRTALFRAECQSVGAFLGKWLMLAFFLESLMVAYVSSEWIVGYVGYDNPYAIPLAALIGAPSYLNGYAAIPLVSGLIDIGMTPSAALAFITAGAVSSIPAAIAVWALVRRWVFVLYLGLGLVGAMTSAWVYQLFGAVL